MDKPQYLTREGLASLERRLDEFIKVRRIQVAQRLKQALQDGGELTENTEYENAKNEQAFIEAEISRLTQIVRNSQIIEEDKISSDIIQIGSRVAVLQVGEKQEEEYQVVGSAEANPRVGKISHESPLGKALIGSKVGEKVKIKAPDGDITFIIKKIL